MSALAGRLGWEVTVVDSRSAFPVPRRLFSGVSRFVTAEPAQLPRELEIRPGDMGVLMTHHYEHDLELLEQLGSAPWKYLAVLGPRARGEKLREALGGVSTALRSPAGLDLGAEGPEAIALSVLSEAQAVRAGRAGSPLADRAGPIHDSPVHS